MRSATFKHNSKKHSINGKFLLILLFLLSSAIGFFLNTLNISDKFSIEIFRIKHTKSLKDQERLYIQLMDRVGPEQAQEMLQHSGIPYTGSAHLLNHTSGYYIWRKFGPSGIIKCKDYFSASCYHGFFISGLGNRKLENIDAMMRGCKRESKASNLQCSHALGHGVLAYQGYANLLEALSMCDDISKRIKDFAVSFCYSGVFMENMLGLHEGRSSPDRWIKASDPLYPCNDPRIAERYIAECWYYQAQQMSKVFKDDNKVAEVCNELRNPKSESNCFDGLFREFNTATKSDIKRKFELCDQMPEEWKSKCISTQASALLQQGDHETPLRICAYIKDPNVMEDCYKTLYWMITELYTTRAGRFEFCAQIPQEYRGKCPD